jgi:hypothetical protein
MLKVKYNYLFIFIIRTDSVNIKANKMRALKKQTAVLQDREALRTTTRVENFQG